MSATMKRTPQGDRNTISTCAGEQTVPGAIHLPLSSMLDQHPSTSVVKLKPKEDLVPVLKAAVPSSLASKTVVVFCEDGVASCMAALGLHEMGVEKWAVLDGGLQAWRRA
eukprot:gene22393-29504_t